MTLGARVAELVPPGTQTGEEPTLLTRDILDRVMSDAELPGDAVRVFYVLLKHMNTRTRVTRILAKTIALATGQSERNVFRHICTLRDAGYLAYANGKPAGKHGGREQATEWFITGAEPAVAWAGRPTRTLAPPVNTAKSVSVSPPVNTDESVTVSVNPDKSGRKPCQIRSENHDSSVSRTPYTRGTLKVNSEDGAPGGARCPETDGEDIPPKAPWDVVVDLEGFPPEPTAQDPPSGTLVRAKAPDWSNLDRLLGAPPPDLTDAERVRWLGDRAVAAMGTLQANNDRVGLLVDLWRKCVSRETGGLGSRLAGAVRAANGDHGLVARCILALPSADYSGDPVRYLTGMVKRRLGETNARKSGAGVGGRNATAGYSPGGRIGSQQFTADDVRAQGLARKRTGQRNVIVGDDEE